MVELGFIETALLLLINWVETAMIWIIVLMILGKSFRELISTDYYVYLTLWVAAAHTFSTLAGMGFLEGFLLTVILIIVYNYIHVKKNIIH